MPSEQSDVGMLTPGATGFAGAFSHSLTQIAIANKANTTLHVSKQTAESPSQRM